MYDMACLHVDIYKSVFVLFVYCAGSKKKLKFLPSRIHVKLKSSKGSVTAVICNRNKIKFRRNKNFGFIEEAKEYLMKIYPLLLLHWNEIIDDGSFLLSCMFMDRKNLKWKEALYRSWEIMENDRNI